ncbi:serine/threonine-protein kinase PITSLRE isoform X2 [Anthonomus grandis grandis]|uniref:serine/threonine-protein kinase PITSLRE isoform X2 n=1 Tax=Anthonomus grandis grandis TaxID=2921223 RepID=UPI0021651B97|nr:serine/threonine-protein kinase PITSLRE isoform X2 [Anthonomus grandis grandis]
MSLNRSEDEQSEDGELRHSPPTSNTKPGTMEQHSEDEDVGDIDSLDIKPPQARVVEHRSRKRGSEKSHHKKGERSDKRREERHSHREKHHRDKLRQHQKEKEQYQREREHYHREKQHPFEMEQQYLTEKAFRDRKAEEHRQRHERKHREVKASRSHSRDVHEKHRKDRHEERGDRATKALADLRERLLEKRKTDDHKSEKSSRKDRRYREQQYEDPLGGEAGTLVKEIINITTEDRKHKKDREGEKQLTEEERQEQEQRREKLLEAEREMARLKERSKAERERRHLERALKRKQEEDLTLNKRQKVEEVPQIVTVSDASEEEEEEEEPQPLSQSDKSESEDDEKMSDRSASRSPSRSKSRSASRSRSPSRSKSYSGEESDSDKRSRSKTRSRSPTRSKSRSPSRSKSSERSASRSKSRSRSPSPEEDEMLKNKDVKPEKASEIDVDLPPYYPAVQGCRSVEEFQCLNRIEEGTYGVVYRARDKRTDEIVALKRLKMEKEKEGFPITSLREINTLLKGQHSNIVTVREIVVGSNMDKIFIVMDYVEHDLKSLMETMRHKKQSFMPGEVKCLLKQLLQAVAHLHDNWILHRDLKTSNLLLSHKGVLKVGDFGLAREYGSPLKAYTPIVVTLWYRAPELLLCAKEYSTPIDVWSVGCIFAELLLMNALFPGKSEVDQLNRIFKDLGTPSEKIWTGFNNLPAVKKMKFNDYPVSNLRAKFSSLSEIGLGMLLKFLTYDPQQRVTAEEALKHPYFTEPPLPIDPAMFPTWPAKSELGHKRAMAASPKPPSGGGEFKKLGGEDDDSYGFRLGMGVDMRRGGAGFSLKF